MKAPPTAGTGEGENGHDWREPVAIHHYSARGPSGIERYLKVSDLANETGIPLRTIYAAIERGEIVTFKPRGCRRGQRIAESEARRWLAACTE